MIEIQQERDKRRFLKRNLAIAKRAELAAEAERLGRGWISFLRRPLIDKIYRPSYVPKQWSE